MSAEESLGKVEELLARLDALRGQIEGSDDPDQVIDALQEVAELAKEIEGELQRARVAAEIDAAGT